MFIFTGQMFCSCIIGAFFKKTSLKNLKKNYCKFFLVYRITGLLLKALSKLIYEVSWFICDTTTSVTLCRAVSMTTKNWELEECSESRKINVFGCQIGPKLKKLERFFSRKGIRRISETIGQVVLQVGITITSKKILILNKRDY